MKNKKANLDKKIPNQLDFPSQTSFLFHSIIKNSKIAGIFILDEYGIILEINPGVHKNFGYSEKDIVGENFKILFTKKDKEEGKPEKELAKVVETGSASDNNYVVHKNGTHKWVHGESIFGKDESGKIYIIKVIYDLNVQHELEKTLLKFNNDLNNFVYTASHDLKAPINNMEGLVEALEATIDKKEDPEEIIGLMKESVVKFKDVLKDLSFVGRMEQGGQGDVVDIKFDEMAENVIYNLKDQIESSNAVIHCDFDNVPKVMFSRKNLRSILHNLLSNAIKYSNPKRRPEIYMSTEKIDGFIVFKIKDNGLGIKESEQDKLFLMYKRIHHHVEGTGIGLTIVQRIMENNGGRIEVESEEGKGSTFLVYFKLAE